MKSKTWIEPPKYFGPNRITYVNSRQKINGQVSGYKIRCIEKPQFNWKEVVKYHFSPGPVHVKSVKFMLWIKFSIQGRDLYKELTGKSISECEPVESDDE